MDTFLKVLQIVPALIGVIKAIEDVMPEGGQGVEKLALVRDIMGQAYDGLDDIWPTLVKVIETVVATFNRLGIFGRKDDEAPAV